MGQSEEKVSFFSETNNLKKSNLRTHRSMDRSMNRHMHINRSIRNSIYESKRETDNRHNRKMSELISGQISSMSENNNKKTGKKYDNASFILAILMGPCDSQILELSFEYNFESYMCSRDIFFTRRPLSRLGRPTGI